jgi:L-ascorbate metabolism protein UlaG (beta-lactamase superfamily)
MTLIPAFQKDEALLADIEAAAGRTDVVTVWWLGQSGFLLGHGHQRILIDPYLSDSLTLKYAGTDKPHVRMGERVIDPAKLPGITLVTSSHNHTDHLDGDTLIPLLAQQPDMKMLIPEANRAFVTDRIGKPFSFPIGLNDGEEVSIDGIKWYGIPAAHNHIDRNADHQCLYMGFVFRFGGLHIYHSGDTLWYEGMEDLLRPFRIDLALLPINGNDPARKVAGNLNAREAAALAKAIGAKMTVPCHYDMFSFNTADPREFALAAEEAGINYTILHLGENLQLPTPKN